jgi:hypothetical protein
VPPYHYIEDINHYKWTQELRLSGHLRAHIIRWDARHPLWVLWAVTGCPRWPVVEAELAAIAGLHCWQTNCILRLEIARQLERWKQDEFEEMHRRARERRRRKAEMIKWHRPCLVTGDGS